MDDETYYITVPRGEIYTIEDADRAARRKFFDMCRGKSWLGTDGADDFYWVMTKRDERYTFFEAARAAYIDVYDGPRFDQRVW